MNILFLAPRLPLPADTGGKIRTWNILKQVSRFAKVHLVCFSFLADDEKLVPQLKAQGIEATLVPAQEGNIFMKVMGAIFGDLPVSIAKYRTKEMRSAITALITKQKFDLMHVDHLHMAHYCESVKTSTLGVIARNAVTKRNNTGCSLLNTRCCLGPAGLPRPYGARNDTDLHSSDCESLSTIHYPLSTVLDEHNVEYRILERCADAGKNWLKKILYRQQAAKTRQFESAAIKKFNAVTAVSEDDAAVLRQIAGATTKVEVLPNGVDTDFFARTVAPLEEAVVFTGSLDWLPNDDAVLYFVEQILPLIWQKKPDLKFYIVGKSPSAQVQRLATSASTNTFEAAGKKLAGQRLSVTGRVDDVRPFLAKSKVFIVPLRIGGGTRLKILEAMSFGIPVVSTSIGAEGIACTPGRDILIADTPEAFAGAVLALVNSDERRAAISSAGRELVLAKYDWKIIGRRLEVIYKEIVSRLPVSQLTVTGHQVDR